MTNAPYSRLQIRRRDVVPHKAFVSPEFASRNVLTDEPWTFVSLWLRRHGQDEAHFYWEQARHFHRASLGLPLESVPLLLYYAFMNAAKALLISRRITFNPQHGVTRLITQGAFTFKSAGVKIKQQGVLPALAGYYGETETSTSHTLPELFFNMAFVHRTFCLTYKSQQDMFVPLKETAFVPDHATGEVFFSCRISEHYSPQQVIRLLPTSLKGNPSMGPDFVRSTASVLLTKPRSPTRTDISKIQQLHHALREDLFYINGARTLWYAKLKVSGPRRLNRQSTTLSLAAMHRLSELSRYEPIKLMKLLTQQKNWLISEFLRMSPGQFIDEIASEITGHPFLTPNVRPPA